MVSTTNLAVILGLCPDDMFDGVVHETNIVVFIVGPKERDVVVLAELTWCLDAETRVLLGQPLDEATVRDERRTKLSGATEKAEEPRGGAFSRLALQNSGLGRQ